MPQQSHNTQERSPRHLPLTPSMVELLGHIMTAIDRRFYKLLDAEEGDYEPDTCAACGGTGLILVPIEDFIIRNTDDEEESTTRAETQAYAMVATPAVITATTGTDAIVLQPITVGPTSIPVVPVPTPIVPITSPVVPSSASVPTPNPASHAPTVPASSSAVTLAAPAPSLTTPSTLHIPASDNPVPTAPSPTVLATPASAPTIPVPTPAAPANSIPPPSRPLPGFHRLGPNYPAPPPTSAVFTDDSADRFYTVTKGIRVGVFGGWQNTSPYVQGVPNAIYNRHSTLSVAYNAYAEAYLMRLVTYV